MLDEKGVIGVYPRAQALADGVLVDAGRTAWEAGIKYPVVLTREVWCRFVEVPDGIEGQDEQGKLADLLNALSGEYETRAGSVSEVLFQLQVRNNNRKPELITLEAVCGRDDDGSPCITVMIPEIE